MVDRDAYIDGAWRRSSGHSRVDVVNPATEEVIADVPVGDVRDLDAAVGAARQAFDKWSTLPVDERADLIQALANELERRAEEITDIVVAEVGTPRRVARWAQVGFGIVDLRNAADGLKRISWQEALDNSTVLREPVGVVGCITPWNFPLHQITAKAGPALAAGCSVVIKPSELAPLTAIALTEAVEAVGFPNGVFNLVNGTGSVVGDGIATHPDVDMVSFTGSNAVGKQVAASAAGTVKRIALELGGKSPSVVLDDADVELAVTRTLRSAFMNAGQACNALSRLLVPHPRLAEAEEAVRSAAKIYAPDDPTDDKTRLGPVVSSQQRERILSFIRSGISEGARLVTGGEQKPASPGTGYYLEPTVFSDVKIDMTIAQEEIFGPVLSILPYDGVDEAVEIANGTVYGLAGAIWSNDQEKAVAVARRIRAAQVEVNGGEFNTRAPFGGYKQSGLGREGGHFGIGEFLELKSLQL